MAMNSTSLLINSKVVNPIQRVSRIPWDDSCTLPEEIKFMGKKSCIPTPFHRVPKLRPSNLYLSIPQFRIAPRLSKASCKQDKTQGTMTTTAVENHTKISKNNV
ncbi:predicted protein [Sclerotinia sclerotiorum 1980 UF-70]|uniref:Uncharacterized protein n=1 Tax=Sclerotinia sclerotiorum (strain ATCC 18683 / 1980 / Ss-1) TaxID=665079 RepID=A7ECG3_SCLS1|nr:predicted protein [Sclerotinia sclerotiorum 1980 UF-70]EDO00142.1 predicted protein [Sclerotinia sclerotiorum 1980 UF-70]